MNKVLLVGNLTKDPEVKTYGETKVCAFTVACQRKMKNKDGQYESDFIMCKAFNQTADFVGKYFKKGNKIGIEGRINTGSYEKDGQRVFTTDISVENVEFAGNRETLGTQQPYAQQQQQNPNYEQRTQPVARQIVNEQEDDQLPF